MTNLKSIAKVFKLGLQNSHVKCVKLKDKEMQLQSMQKQLKKKKNFGNKVSKN